MSVLAPSLRRLNWRTMAPIASTCAAHDPPPWIREIWSLRGRALYENGQRPEFRTGSTASDPDEVDLSAWHILGETCGNLVGCIRATMLTDTSDACLTERVFGEPIFKFLRQIGVERQAIAEVGRWSVDPDCQDGLIATRLVGGVWSLLQSRRLAIAIATVGTRNGQDRLLHRFGLEYVPDCPRVESSRFADDICAMYAVLESPAPSFLGVVKRMASALQYDSIS